MQIGPAIIVAAVVLGPGSIVNASRVGCRYGYDLLWIVLIAGALMMAATAASMQIGVFSKDTPCDFLRRRFGRGAAWCVGGSLLFAIVLFQASNNHAIAVAMEGMSTVSSETEPETDWQLPVALVLGTNLLVIALLIAGKRDLYRWIERLMMVLVGLMLLAFLSTLVAIGPDWTSVLAGLWPTIPTQDLPTQDTESSRLDWMSAAALMATTFSVAAAFFQSYQVRQREWKPIDLSAGRQDSVIGVTTLVVMTMAIVITAAGALHGRVDASELSSAVAVSAQLRPLFGDSAAMLFSIGILAGALSSFVVNALIGGVVGSDAIGKGSHFSSAAVRTMTIVSLLIGMVISIGALVSGVELVSFIIVAQALTVLSFPLLALTLISQWSEIRSQLHPREQWIVGAGLYAGFAVVAGLAVRTLVGLIG